MEYFVTADDFGNTLTITQAINECILRGWVQNTCLLLNREALEQAVQLAKQNSYMDKVCFHLNLSTGYPLTDSIKKTRLCDSSGKFCEASNAKIHRFCLSRYAIEAIREECEAQIKLFRSLGFTSIRIDSHMWRMCNLPVLIAIRPLIKKYGFKTTRTLSGHLLNSCKGLMRIYYRIMQFIMNLFFEVKENWCGSGGEFSKAIKKGKNISGVIELYVHPDMVDNIPTDIFYSYSSNYANRESRSVENVVSYLKKHGDLFNIEKFDSSN